MKFNLNLLKQRLSFALILLVSITNILMAQTCPDDVGGTKYYVENDPSIDSRTSNALLQGEDLIITVRDVTDAPPAITSFVKLAPDGSTSSFTFPSVSPRTNDNSDNFEYFQLENGNILMCWYSPSASKGFTDIYFKIFDAAGNEVRSATKINTMAGELNRFPDIEQLSNGNIIFVWATSGVDYSMRRFSEGGVAVDADQISVTDLAGFTSMSQYRHKVAANNNGKFIILIQNTDDNYYGMIFNNNSDIPNLISGSNTFAIPAGGSTSTPYVETLSTSQFLLVYRVQTGSGTETRSIAYKIYNDDGSVARDQVVRRQMGSGGIQDPFVVDNGFYLSYRINTSRESYLEFFDNFGNFVSDHSSCVPEFSSTSSVNPFVDVDGNLSYVVNAVESGTDRNIWVVRQSSVLGSSNTAPTASGFKAANGPYENLTYSFTTSDFGYSDSDFDPLSNLVISALPAAGTLYVDADNDDTYDGGEEVSLSDQISKADLDAGNLQYIQNSTTNTTFQFKVNDGIEDSVESYTATIDMIAKPTVVLSLNTSSQIESISSGVEITASLSNVFGAPVTVNILPTGTATNSTDYSLSSNSITIPAGELSEKVAISNIDDAILEENETVIIDIASVINGTEQGMQQVVYAIENDDLAMITIADASGLEDAGPITLTATLSHAVVGGFSVDISTNAGTASAGDRDYISLNSRTLTFSGTAGETQTFSINPTADSKLEADETVSITQSNLSGTSLAMDITDNAFVTILNDDAAAVTIEDVSGYEDAGSIMVTATLDNAVQGGFSMIANRIDLTARMDSNDYGPRRSESLTFEGIAGETKTFLVTPRTDDMVEEDETVEIAPSNLSGTSLPVTITDSGIVTILNDDSTSIIIEDVSGNEDDGAITMKATLQYPVQDGYFTVDVSTVDGIATLADNDYTALINHTLTFSGMRGETQTFTIVPTADDQIEGNETFSIIQGNLDETSLLIDISDGAEVTILNDDSSPVINVNQSYNIDENAVYNSLIATILANDVDSGTTLENWTITETTNRDGDGDPTFRIDASTGELFVNDADELDFEENPVFHLKISVSDGRNISDEETIEIKLNDLDDSAAILTTNTGISLDEGASEIIDPSELLATDIDTDDNLIIYEITTAPTNGRLELFTDSGISITSFSQSQLLANEVVYIHNGSNGTSDSFTFDLQDGSGNILRSQIFRITITDVNDNPVIKNLKNDQVTYTEGGNPVHIDAGMDAVVIDPDMNGGELNFLFYSERNFSEDQLGIDTSGDVQLINSAGFVEVEVDGVRIGHTTIPSLGNDLIVNLYPGVTDALLTKLVRSFTYENVNPGNPDPTPRQFFLNLNDGNGGSTATMDLIFTVNIEEINDNPTLSGIPTDITVEEEKLSILQLGTVKMTDPDAGNGIVELFLEVNSGILTATSDTGLTITNSGTNMVGLSGTISDINSYLNANNITYTGPINLTGEDADLLSLSGRDNGNKGIGGGSLLNFGSANIDIIQVNDAPEIIIPAVFTVIEDTTTPLSNFSLMDNDAGTESIELQIEVGRGVMEARESSVITVSNTNTSMISLVGSIPALNSFIASEGILYTPKDNDVANVQIDFVVNDLGNTGSGGSQMVNDSAIISINGENDAPIVTAPDTQILKRDEFLSFNSANANAITLEDIDAETGDLRLELKVNNGSLNLASLDGLTFLSGDGSNDNLMVIEGTLSDLNAALNNLTYSPPGGYVGTAEINIDVNDQGNSGSGEALRGQGIVLIKIEPKNPLVELVSSDNANGLYGIGDLINIQVKFDQVVMVTGIPRLLLDTGDLKQYATYNGGSGTELLSFTYQIEEGDFSMDLSYTNTNALEFNGGSIQSIDGSKAILDLPVSGTTNSLNFEKQLIIDGIKPIAITGEIIANLNNSGTASITAIAINDGSNDNLSAMTDLSISINKSDFNCDDVGDNSIAFTVVDEAGNSTTVRETITVQDIIAPVVLTQNITIELDERGVAIITPDMINNGSSDACGIKSLRLNKVNFDCSDVGDNIVELEVEDINGNIARAPGTVFIQDNMAPIPQLSELDDIVTSCQLNEEDLIIPSAIDNCSDNVDITHNGNFPITQAGTTQITWTYKDGNGNSVIQTQDIVIKMSSLDEVTFKTASFIYDGTPKSIFVENLPENASVTYEGNGQTDAGSYLVRARITSTSANCPERILTAEIVINKAEAIITSNSPQTFAYNGEVKMVTASLNHSETDLKFEPELGYSNVGSYPITIHAAETDNYKATSKNVMLVIEKGELDEVIFSDTEFVYDGTEKNIYVNNLPEGASVRYQGNGKVNAGIYEVRAIIKKANYNDQTLKASLKIAKAQQVLDFQDLAVRDLAIDNNFMLNASSSSGLPVKYSFRTENENPAARVTRNGYVTLIGEGEILITASQEGNVNYDSAEPVSKVLKVINSLADPVISIGNFNYENPSEEIYYRMECGSIDQEVEISIEVADNIEVVPGRRFNVNMSEPGIYRETVEIYFEGSLWKTYDIVIEKQFVFDDIVVQKFNNVLLVNNNPSTNGGYDFIDYKWYKDGRYIGSGQYYSAGGNTDDQLDPNADYYVVLTTTDRQELRSCIANITLRSSNNVRLAPNPVEAGEIIEFYADFSAEELQDMKISLVNLNGKVIKKLTSNSKVTKIQIPYFAQKGMYLLIFETSKRKKSIKFLIK